LTKNTLLLFTIAVFFITAQELPAPISEEPTPTANQKHVTKARARNSGTVKAPVKKTATMADQEVDVLLSENTQAALRYLRDYVEGYEKMPFAGKSDVKPDEILPRLKQVLSSRFRNVSIINGSSQNRVTKGGLVMVFDLQAKVGSWSGTHNTISLSGTFKDGSGKALQTITAAGSTTVPYPAWRTHFPEALSAALTEFSQKLGDYRQ
jgi:hypothetical protein